MTDKDKDIEALVGAINGMYQAWRQLSRRTGFKQEAKELEALIRDLQAKLNAMRKDLQ